MMHIFFFVYIYLFLYAFIVTLILVPIVEAIAMRHHIVALPKKDRHHSRPTALLGGVAIIGAFYSTILINFLCVKLGLPVVNYYVSELMPYLEGATRNFPKLFITLICGFMIFVLGLLDDIKSLGPKRKFLFEIFVGLVLYACKIKITVFGSYEFLNLFATVLWVVAITNAFNLLDNIDGLAAGVAFVASFILFLFCVIAGQILVSALLVIFMATLLGFLRYNYSPARIFMGDSGSLFIGFMMSMCIIMATFYADEHLSIVPLAAPIMILSVPLYDTLSVIIIRIKNRQSIFVGDKNHFSHRLVRIGMTDRQAVSFILLVGLCTGMGALSLIASPLISQCILLFQTVMILLLLHVLKTVKTNNSR